MATGPGMLTDRIWIDPVENYGEAVVEEICHELDICQGVARILAARDLLTVAEASDFLNPSPEQLHDPSLFLGMDAAVRRIERAIDRFEKIVIFGDYDVDGTASTAILYNYLKRTGARAHYFMPDRMIDGYGLNIPTIDKIKASKAELVITVDNGSTAIAESRYLADQGIDLIITDHHQMGQELPVTVALVNAHQPDCPYPFKELSATGVAYKVVCALDRRLTERNFWDERGLCHTQPDYYLDLVALATVADMSPLVGENRVLVTLGLKLINERPRPGLAGLIKECNIRFGVSPSTISFKIAPKINALGRIGDPRIGIQMLLARSYTEGRRLARYLCTVNRKRQEIERAALAGAMKQLEAYPEGAAFVLVGNDWHPGVIGIIATRIAYQYRKPTVVITLAQNDLALGSARGCGTMSVLNALESCQDLLERYGGHANAAGLALQPENVGAFRERFSAAIEEAAALDAGPQANRIEIETWITPDLLDTRFLSEMTRLSPFGHGNPEPVVAVRGLNLEQGQVFHNRDLKLSFPGPKSYGDDSAACRETEWSRQLSGSYDVALAPQVRYGPDGLRTQLKVLDLRSMA